MHKTDHLWQKAVFLQMVESLEMGGSSVIVQLSSDITTRHLEATYILILFLIPHHRTPF